MDDATFKGRSRYHMNRTEGKDHAVKIAVSEMLASNTRVTITAVSKHAQVSRAFIYNHSDLYELVRRAAAQWYVKAESTTRNSVASTEAQMRAAERLTYTAKIKELKGTIETQRSEIRSLRGERSRWLGGQVELLAGPSQELSALQEALSDSLVERDKLQKLTSDHLKRADQLDRKLNAARQAYKEVFEAKQTSHDNVVSIDGTDRTS